MRRISKLISAATVALISMLGFGSLAFAESSESAAGSRIVSSQALVQLEPSSEAEVTLAGLNPSPVGSSGSNLFLVELDPFIETNRQIAWLGQLEGVAFAEPNYVLALQAEADDPKVVDGSSWGLYGSATSPSSSDGANAVGAWSSGYTGNSAVYVAVIDSGIDVSHPDLSANIWTNAGEIAGNGIDDDGNGYVDDVNGFDFINSDGSVYDTGEHPHGTHVAGIIGAQGNNAEGVSGVNWNVKLISAKMMNADGQSNIANAISAIDYITELRTQKGLDIIASNNSWGGTAYSRALEDAIKRGGDAGIIFVAAAGNDAVNLDSTAQYPAAYDCTTTHRLFDCVVSVAALNEDGSLAGYSNFSSTKVDLAAPGTNVMSTLPGGGYGLLSGTSMAAPFVTGSLALCVGAYRGTSAEIAISKLKSTVVADANLSGKVATGGRLNISSHVSSCAGDATAFSGNLSEALTSATYTDRARVDWEDTSAGDFEQEIQVAVGPNGCRGTFSHFAFIGPGLTTYPALELEEAQFYCFRVRTIKDGSVSSWATSNVAITWTSNLPFIYGKVLMADGTPVHKMPVKWLAEGAYAGLNNSEANTVYTNVSGEYVMQVSNGTPGYLFADTTRFANSGQETNPLTPWGFEVGGYLTISQDVNLNLTLPPIEYLNLRITDSETGAAVSGAKVQFVGYSKDCKNDGYLLFSGATSPTCSFWPAGYDHSGPAANSNGEVTIPVVAGSQTSNDDYQFIVSDPNDPNTAMTIDWTSGATQNVDVALNPPSALSGTVYLSDGTTPIAGINVMWLNAGQNAGFNFRNTLATTTDSNGAYTLEVPEGSVGRLFANTSRTPASARPSTPLTPWGLEAGGNMTVSSSQTINLTLPDINILTFNVTDHESGAPVVGAKVEFNGYTKGCVRNVAYEPFPGATSPHCVSWPTGYSSSVLRTNQSGQLSIAVLDHEIISDNNYSFLVVTPGANSTTTVVQVSPTEDTTLNVVTNPPAALTGKIFLSDGTTPVEGAPVKWVNEDEYAGINYADAQTSVTDSEGNYSLEVPPGSRGKLLVVTSRTPVRSAPTSPQIPWGLEVGGFLTVTESRTVDLTLPKQNLLTFKVTEYASTDAIVGATVEFSGYSKNCRSGIYTPFPGAESPVCSFWPGGYAHSEPITNSQGEAKIALFDDSMLADNNYTWIVSHPFDLGRVARITIAPTTSGVVTVGMPGTPSQPEQPEATALTEEVELTWTEPWNGGAYIDYYKVWVSLNADGPFTPVTSGSCAGNIDPELRSCVVSDLTPGVTYYFAIIAHNIVGYSEPSISIASVPLEGHFEVGVFVHANNPVTGASPELVLLAMNSLASELDIAGSAKISELGSGYVRFILDDSQRPHQSLYSFRDRLQAKIGLPVHIDYQVQLDPQLQVGEQRVATNAVQSKPPWNLDRIDQSGTKLDGRYDFETDGEGVEIWVVDSGVNPNHVEYKDRLNIFAGWGGDSYDCNGHGTHVAATAVGEKYGVAKGATLSSIKMLDCDGSGPISRLVEAIDYIISNKSGPTVANFSLGTLGSSSSIRGAFLRLVNSGVVPVVAAGNEGTFSCNSLLPNSRVGEISVGAVDKRDKRASFSNFGSCTDIYAPGVDITSAWWTGNTATRTISGTSMASPLVAGLAARILQRHPDDTPAEIKSRLLDKALPFSTGIAGDARHLANMMEPPSYSEVPVPEITGAAEEGATLRLDPGVWPDKPKLKYQWYSKDPDSGALTPIKKATKTSYMVTNKDTGNIILAKVTATKAGYPTEVTVTNEIGPIAIPEPPSYSEVPVPEITGAAEEGATLRLDPGVWPDKPKLKYQWYSKDPDSGALTPIKKATKTSYKVTNKDTGNIILAKVTATKAGYPTEVTVTNEIGPIAIPEPPSYSEVPVPEITGAAEEGATLRLDPGVWPDKPKLKYQWYSKDPDSGALTPIKKATKTSYKVTNKDTGNIILAKVTATKAGYPTEVTVTNEIGPISR